MRGAEKGQSTEHTHGQPGKRKRKEDSKGTERKGPGAKARNETVCLGEGRPISFCCIFLQSNMAVGTERAEIRLKQ